MAYADKYSEEMKDGNFDYEVTLSDVKAKMSEGSIEERIPLGATYSITGFKVGNAEYVIGNEEGEKVTAESPLKIPTEGMKTLEVKTGIEVNGEAGEKRYFALVQGGYYEIRIANSKIEYINENPMTLEEINATGSSSASPVLEVTLKDGSSEIVTLGQVNQTNQKVDITGVSTGNGILTVTYGTGKSIVSEEVNINVTGGYLVSFYNQENDSSSIIASYTVAENDDAINYPQYVIPMPPEGKYLLNWYVRPRINEVADAMSYLKNVNKDLNVYANFKEPVKYAVQIYGINQDVDENDQTLGLTFGPATGDDYNNKYVTHDYRDNDDGTYTLVKQIYTIGNNVPSEISLNVKRTSEEIEQYGKKIHDMTWTQISAENNKEVFTDSMLCGDTKSVNLELNIKLRGNWFSSYIQAGDGAGIIGFQKWNPSKTDSNDVGTGNVNLSSQEESFGSNARNAGGYKTSHIRSTLIGKTLSTPIVGYAGNDNLDTEDCLYSCIESELQDVIVAKQINYVTGSAWNSPRKNSDISDKIWLFSEKELNGIAYSSGDSYEGIGNVIGNEVAYKKFTDTNTQSNSKKACNENGTYSRWWLRSPAMGYTYTVAYVCNKKVQDDFGSEAAYSSNCLGFGFCIR